MVLPFSLILKKTTPWWVIKISVQFKRSVVCDSSQPQGVPHGGYLKVLVGGKSILNTTLFTCSLQAHWSVMCLSTSEALVHPTLTGRSSDVTRSCLRHKQGRQRRVQLGSSLKVQCPSSLSPPTPLNHRVHFPRSLPTSPSSRGPFLHHRFPQQMLALPTGIHSIIKPQHRCSATSEAMTHYSLRCGDVWRRYRGGKQINHHK